MTRFEAFIQILPQLEVEALRYFRQDALAVENKSQSGFDPVTLADKSIETLFREGILSQFPQDAILGEEFPHESGHSGYQWTIDPIDGTRAFYIGSPSFTILTALEGEDEEFFFISQPFLQERFFAYQAQAFYERQGEKRIIKSSNCRRLYDAKLCSTMPEIGTDEERQAFDRLAQNVQLTRYGLDGYAYALLAMGMVDLVVEAGLKPFDYRAPMGLIRAAGGYVCNWEGQEPHGVDRLIAAANSDLAEAALNVLHSGG